MVLTAVVMKTSVFCDITPFSPLKVNRLLATCFTLVSYLDHEDGGDMFLRTSVDIQRTTRRYIPEDRTQQESSVT
jgi:hypothetical protein